MRDAGTRSGLLRQRARGARSPQRAESPPRHIGIEHPPEYLVETMTTNLPIEQLVAAIHRAPTRLVLALSGGSGALSALLTVPGASGTVLEAVVPYCESAMIHWMGGRTDQFCSSRAARAMAVAAFHRAVACAGSAADVAGIGCTASLATYRPKRGEHRAHVAWQTSAATAVWSLRLEKGRRDRQAEEEIVARLVLNAVADVCGIDQRLDLTLSADEPLETAHIDAPPAWQDLFLGRTEAVCCTAPAEPVRAILPGAFNPVHVGHRRMLAIAAEMLGTAVAVELSIVNVDKPPLDYHEIAWRVGQFDPPQVVWLTRAATFDQKARLFPGATFVVGTDTLRRIAAAPYYGDDETACQAALQRIVDRGCRFLVFGRDLGPGFVRLGDLDLPDFFRAVCREVPPEVFRETVSSTAIRRQGKD